MRFSTFNLWHGLAPSTPVAFEALEPGERKKIREELQEKVLAALNSDVYFFQEANPVGARADRFATLLNSTTYYQPDLVGLKLFGLGLPLNLNSGLVTAIGKKWSAKKIEAISLSRPGWKLVHGWGSWQMKEERFALFSEVMLPGWGRVLLVNTHLHHGLESTPALSDELERIADELKLTASAVSELKDRLARGNLRRSEEVSVLFRAIEKHQRRYQAVVVAGDFNSGPESHLGDMFREMGFRDAWAEANPGDPGLTFDHTRNEANHLLQGRFPLTLVVEDLTFSAKIKEALMTMAKRQEMRPRRIDYIWFRSDSVPLKAKKATLFGLPDETGLAPSDHFGVSVDIEAAP